MRNCKIALGDLERFNVSLAYRSVRQDMPYSENFGFCLQF